MERRILPRTITVSPDEPESRELRVGGSDSGNKVARNVQENKVTNYSLKIEKACSRNLTQQRDYRTLKSPERTEALSSQLMQQPLNS